MIKLRIHRTSKADTRHCEGIPSKKELYKDSLTHIKDVKKVLKEISKIFSRSKHDFTKISYIDLFYKDFIKTIKEGFDFKQGDWYQLHVHVEHHHPEDCVADDINLFDIIEYIADNVCAGKARSGKVRDLKLKEDVLEKAFQNTVKYIDEMTEIE